MTSYTKMHKYGKLLSVVLAVSLCLALVCGVTYNAFAKNLSSDAVKTVFFYATDTNGQAVYVSSATMGELTNSEFCHGQADGKNYYNALVDTMPAAVYAEGVGVTLDDFVTYMAGRSSAANADKLSFKAENNGNDRLVFTANDGASSNLNVTNVFKTPRYYFPDLSTYLKTTDGDRCIPAEDLDKVLASKQQMPVYLATSSAFSRVNNIQDQIAANGGVLTGCLKDSLGSDDALRLMIPMTIADLGEDGSEVEIGANKSAKWVYLLTLKYKNNSDSPLTSAGSVAAPTCSMVLDGTTLKVTFNCTTEGAEIYHSLNVDGDTVSSGVAPQNKYDGKTIEIKNYDTKSPVNIRFRAVKPGCTDAGIATVSTADYTLPPVEEAPNFVYSLTADKENFKVGESFNLSAALTADADVKVYDMEYQIKVPAAFSVENVQTTAGWQYGQAFVDGSKVLTFISTNEENGVDMTKDTALKFADITLKPVAEGEAEITVGDKTITKSDASVYANVTGDGMNFTVEPGEVVLSYQMKTATDKEKVNAGETFDVSVLVDSAAVKSFGGAQALISYDKALVALDSVKTIADGFESTERADGIMLAGFGGMKEIGENGYSLITLTFKALENLPSGTHDAVFGLSNAMVSANGEPSGITPDVTAATVKIQGQTADYQLIAQANPTEVKAGESFTVKVLVDSAKLQSFGGMQGLLSFNKDLVAYDGVASRSDEFDTLGIENTANGIFLAGAGQVKTISEGGFEVAVLNFHALSDLTAGTYDAVFDWSATQVVPNGQITGIVPDTTSATVKITAEEQGQTTKVMKFDFNRNGEVDLLDVQFAYRLAWGAIQVNTDEEQKFLNYLFVEGYENNPGDAAFELTDFQKVYRQAWGADENYTIDMPNNLIKYYDVFSSR